jgi:hypothetical protein
MKRRRQANGAGEAAAGAEERGAEETMSGRGSAGKRKSEGEVCITHFPLCGGRGRFVALPLRSETDASTNDDDEEETEEEGEEEGLEADGKEREDFGRGR